MQNFTPKIHYYVKKGWLNDPNGLVYHNGEYHLFYQHYPHGTQWGPMHWGHAVSKDLIEWEELPIALSANDEWMFFSGSAVVDKNNTSGFFDDNDPGLVVIFTSAKAEKFHGIDLQQQGIAYSKDNGRTWIEYDRNPVISNMGIPDFRDPKVVWYEEEKKWVMVLAEYDHIKFFESYNLKEWKFLFDFGHDIGVHDDVWECPDLLRFNDKWILKISVQAGSSAGGSGEFYFVGNFNGNEFVPDSPDYKWLDYGKDFYASQSYFNVNNRNILIGWMNNIKYQNIIPAAENRRGFMALPREINFNGDEIIQRPVRELDNYRLESIIFDNLTVDKDNPFECKLFDTAQEINIAFDAVGYEDTEIIIENNCGENISLKYVAETEEFIFSRDNSGILDWHGLAKGIQKAKYNFTARMDIKIILDICNVEIFINGGKIIFTNLVFPSCMYNKLIMKGEMSSGDIDVYKY